MRHLEKMCQKVINNKENSSESHLLSILQYGDQLDSV